MMVLQRYSFGELLYVFSLFF